MMIQKGFTLVELMVVVVIVALLAALLIPMLTARIEAARWSEGKAGAGSIATSLRAYVVERAELEPSQTVGSIVIENFMNLSDLSGKYFQSDDYTIIDGSVTYDPSIDESGEYLITYTIQVTPGSVDENVKWTKEGYTLDHTGEWKEIGVDE